jgi:hypothetical protein
VDELVSTYQSYNGALAQTIKNASAGTGAFSGYFAMDNLDSFVNGIGIINSGKTGDGVTAPNDGWVGVGPLTGVTAAGSQRLIIHNRFNSGVIRFSTAGAYRGTILSGGGLIVGPSTAMVGSELLRVEGAIQADSSVAATDVTATVGSYIFSVSPTLKKVNFTTPSAPDANQFQITANTGRFTVLTYNGDNTQVAFDADWTSGAGWIARHSAVAWIRKLSSLLSFYSSTGNSVGGAPTETLRAFMDLSNGYWSFGNTTAARRRIDSLDTAGPQIRATYTDNSVYTDIQTDSNGYTLFTNTGKRYGFQQSSPQGTVHITQDTIGSEVFRIESTATNDDPSDKFYHGRVATTDATLTTINTVAIPASTTVFIEATVRARRTGGASGTAEDAAAYVIRGTFKNVAGTATIVNTSLDYSGEDQAAWDCQLNVSAGNALLQILGAAGNNVTWHSTVKVCSVGS